LGKTGLGHQDLSWSTKTNLAYQDLFEGDQDLFEGDEDLFAAR
jgi:hypothetical protein